MNDEGFVGPVETTADAILVLSAVLVYVGEGLHEIARVNEKGNEDRQWVGGPK